MLYKMGTEDNIKIGGEFEINSLILCDYPSYKPNDNLFMLSSGRGALIFILKQIEKTKNKVIHIPFYICSSVVNACRQAGFQVRFYELNNKFILPLEYLNSIKKNEVLLTVNYFGFVDDNPTILKVKDSRPDITVISDQVQSFWTYDKTEADYSFTSLRKHIPIPEGALVYEKDKKINFDISLKESSFYKTKLIGSLLKHQGLPDKLYLKFFEEGENELDNEHSLSKASSLSHYLYENFDFEEAQKKRRVNYKLVYKLGLDNGIDFLFPYNENITPLNVPVLLKNRDKIRVQLKNYNIFLPVHWPLADYNSTSIISKKMAQNELSLVIDQRYSIQEMDHQINCLIKSL